MSAIMKSQRYALFRFIPNYYDIDDGFVQKIVVEAQGVKEYPSSSEENQALDKDRLQWILFDRIKSYPASKRPSDADLSRTNLKFVTHLYVRKMLEPDIFHCTQPQCGRLYTMRELPRNRRGSVSFECPIDHGDLRQIPFLWVHSECGNVEPFRADNCPVCQRTQSTTVRKLRLKLNNNDLGKSYWFCGCGYSTEPRSGNPNARRFSRVCSSCYSKPDVLDPYMRPMPAIKVYKPQSFSTFKLTGDWKRLVGDWFGIKLPEPSLTGIPDAIRAGMARDPAFRQRILDMMPVEGSDELYPILEKLGLRDQDGNRRVIQELMEFAGVRYNLEGKIELSRIEPESAKVILDRFGVNVSYLDNLPIVEGTFGSLVGTSDRQRARLILIDGPIVDQKWVFVREFRTEGLLIDLPPSQVTHWLAQNGYDTPNIREVLLTASENDPIFTQVKALLHSISHLLIRKSDIFSGVSRETLAEFLFPRSLALLLYNTRGSELGMLRTTFEGKMYNWLHAALAGATRCVYDPICGRKKMPCHGCMFIAERNCPLFNQCLDRDLLVWVRGDTKVGYWAQR